MSQTCTFCFCTGEIGKFCRGLGAFAGAGGGRSFVQLAALAGCDYIDNVKGIGLLSALPVVTKFQCIPADKRVSRILMHLQKMGKTASTWKDRWSDDEIRDRRGL